MAYIDYIGGDFGNGSADEPPPYVPPPDPSMGGRQGVTDPPFKDPGPATGAGSVGGGIPWAPGASQPSSSPAGYHWDANLANFVADTAGTTTSTTGGDLRSRITAQLAYAKSSDDPEYWFQKISADPNGAGSAWGYWADRINRGDNAQLGLARFQDSGGSAAPAAGPNPGGYTDPSSMLYLNQLMQRLTQVQQPQDTGLMDMLKSLALARVNSLNAPPYSPADEQALITKYRDPLTQARDAAYQRNKETASQHGYAPSSGLLRHMDTQTNQGYEQGIAQGANQMGVNAVALKNQNAQQQLSILASLLQADNSQFDRANARQDQAVNLAKMFPDFDAQRLSQLLQASQDTGGASAINGLTNLGQLNLSTLGMNNANDQANSAAWGKLIASLIAAAAGG